MNTSSVADHVQSCQEEGFARIPQVFSTEEIDLMRAEALLSMRGTPDLEVRLGYPTLLYWPQREYLTKISTDDRIIEIVELYYGHQNFKLETCQWYWHLPGDPDEFAWHTDERFRPGVKNRYLQTAIVIDPWTDDNSAVEFIKGSHLKPFENSGDLRKFVRGELRGDRLHAEPGDVLTWSNTVVHGSERNVGRTPRSYYMNGFGSEEDAIC